jgi:hypothetical protein
LLCAGLGLTQNQQGGTFAEGQAFIHVGLVVNPEYDPGLSEIPGQLAQLVVRGAGQLI